MSLLGKLKCLSEGVVDPLLFPLGAFVMLARTERAFARKNREVGFRTNCKETVSSVMWESGNSSSNSLAVTHFHKCVHSLCKKKRQEPSCGTSVR